MYIRLLISGMCNQIPCVLDVTKGQKVKTPYIPELIQLVLCASACYQHREAVSHGFQLVECEYLLVVLIVGY